MPRGLLTSLSTGGRVPLVWARALYREWGLGVWALEAHAALSDLTVLSKATRALPTHNKAKAGSTELGTIGKEREKCSFIPV